MSAPRLPEDATRSQSVVTRFTPIEVEAIDKAAARWSCTRSEWIRLHALRGFEDARMKRRPESYFRDLWNGVFGREARPDAAFLAAGSQAYEAPSGETTCPHDIAVVMQDLDYAPAPARYWRIPGMLDWVWVIEPAADDA